MSRPRHARRRQPDPMTLGLTAAVLLGGMAGIGAGMRSVDEPPHSGRALTPPPAITEGVARRTGAVGKPPASTTATTRPGVALVAWTPPASTVPDPRSKDLRSSTTTATTPPTTAAPSTTAPGSTLPEPTTPPKPTGTGGDDQGPGPVTTPTVPPVTVPDVTVGDAR